MNNKGFAITTILYGIMILFCLLLVSLLSILSSYRKTQEVLIEQNNGARDILNNGSHSSESLNGGETSEYTLRFVCTSGTFKGENSEFTFNSGETFSFNSLDYACENFSSGLLFRGWNTDMNATSGLTQVTINNSDITLYSIFRSTGGGGNARE